MILALGSILYKIAFLTFTIAFGGILYQHVVEFRNWSSNIPDSLYAYRGFFRVSDFGRFFKMFMPLSGMCLLASVVMMWNTPGDTKTWLLISTGGALLTAGFTNVYFVRRHRKLFEEPIDEKNTDELTKIADQWKSANYFRMFLMAITIVSFLEGMKLLN